MNIIFEKSQRSREDTILPNHLDIAASHYVNLYCCTTAHIKMQYNCAMSASVLWVILIKKF